MDRDDKRPQNEQDFQDQAYDDQGYATNGQGQGDEWQEQPVDDFIDDTAENPEAGAMEEGADEFQQLPDDGADEAPAAARAAGGRPAAGGITRYLPFVGGIAAVAVVGFLGWQQMSSMIGQQSAGKGSMASAMNQQSPDASTLPPPAPPITPPDAMIAQQTPPMQQIAPPQEQQQQPAPVQEQAQQQPAEQQPQPQQMQPQPQPQAEQSPVTTMPVTQSAATPAPSTPTPAPAPAEQTQTSDLNRQLEEMRAHEAQLNSQIASLQQSATQANETAQATIRSLEEKISQLQANTTSTSSSASSSSSSSSTMMTSSEHPSRAFQRRKTGAKKSSHATDSEAVRLQREVNNKLRGGAGAMSAPAPMASNAPMMMPAPAQPQQMNWLLRSAQPGSAWLSLGGSNNLRRVAPGDKVQGLGTIISIRQIAGRWVVEGTEASVR